MTDHRPDDDITLIPEMLPGILCDVAHISSVAKAIRLARKRGGTKIYLPFPHRIGPGHWLCQIFTLDEARAISKVLGQGVLKCPSAKIILRWYEANRLWRQGKTEPQIALALGLHDSSVRRLLRHGERRKPGRIAGLQQAERVRREASKTPKNPGQLDMFNR